ncbi:MAG: MBL fold metallo-hydrolase, partial [Terriglobales bacterium]
VEKAHARGLRVSAHVETAADFREAVRAGVDMIAHLPGWQIGPGTGFTDNRLDHWKISVADARLAASKKVAVITTAAHDPKGPNYARFNEINRHNLRLLREAGADIILGSDGFQPADRREALYLAEVGGLDNLAILKLLAEATPRLIFPKRKIGTLREGYEANFLVLQGNPLEDLQNLGRIHLRVKGGEELKAEEPIVITTSLVGGNVHMLDGAVDLIGVSVGEDGLLLVDGGYMETLPAVREALDKFSRGKPRFLINTHWHHGFANEGFARDAVLVSHRAARERLRRENFMFNRTVPARPPAGWPVITFEGSMTIPFNGEDVRLVHFPEAHTDGDVVVFFSRSNVVMTGDIFVPHVPWTDRNSGGRVSGLVAAIDRLLNLVPHDAKIIPGHGNVCTYDDLKRFRVLLDETIARVKARVREGRSLADVQKEGLPGKWKDWEGPVPVSEFLKAIYEEVRQEQL